MLDIHRHLHVRTLSKRLKSSNMSEKCKYPRPCIPEFTLSPGWSIAETEGKKIRSGSKISGVDGGTPVVPTCTRVQWYSQEHVLGAPTRCCTRNSCTVYRYSTFIGSFFIRAFLARFCLVFSFLLRARLSTYALSQSPFKSFLFPSRPVPFCLIATETNWLPIRETFLLLVLLPFSCWAPVNLRAQLCGL